MTTTTTGPEACRRCGAEDWLVVLARDEAGVACLIRCRGCGAAVRARADDPVRSWTGGEGEGEGQGDG